MLNLIVVFAKIITTKVLIQRNSSDHQTMINNIYTNTLFFKVLIISLIIPTLDMNTAFSQTARTNPMTTFEVKELPAWVSEIKWNSLLSDKENDGQYTNNTADGKSFAYFYDSETEQLWFKWETYKPISTFPALSVSIDTDANQENGVNWYGEYRAFKFEKMISVGPIRKNDDGYYGYNGITDEEGVRTRNWINVKKNVVHFYETNSERTFIISIDKNEIADNLKTFNVIASVGENARWNDDIGDNIYATINLIE